MKTLLATRLLATISLLLLLVLCSELASAQTDTCPDEVTECDVDPCQEQECNRFYSATCVPNFCHGLCTANFFWRGKNVTDDCETVTCDTRRTPCRGTRQCMEMVVPPTCPEDQPVCRQYLRTRCVLMEVDVDRPMTCSDVSCEESMACRLRIRTEDFPPVVRCLPESKVSECVTGTCNDGLTCVDDGPSVQCVAATPSPTTAVNTTTSTTTPSPTTAVNTTSTTPNPTTAVNTTSTTPNPTTAVNTTSTTTTPRPFPTCEALNCSNLGLICNETSIMPFCDLPASCDDITCPSGTTCTLQLSFPSCSPVFVTCEQLNCSNLGLICNETSIIPFCDLPTSCDDITCPSGTTCTLQLSFPSCSPVFVTCEQLNCSNLGLICNETSIIPFCDLPTSCDDITCPSGTTCTLQLSFPSCSPVFVTCEQLNCSNLGLICNETSIIPFCDLPTSCDDITCPSGTTCTLQLSFPSCSPVFVTCEQLNCSNLGLICNETSIIPFCDLPTSCDDITCPSGTTCTLQLSFAFCFPVLETCEQLNCSSLGLICNETSIIPFCDRPTSCGNITCPEFERCVTSGDFFDFPICFTTTQARTCDQLICPPDTPSCYLLSNGSDTIAQCVDENIFILGFQTCEGFSCDEGTTCVNLTQDGTIISPFCTILDCAGNDDCSSNDTCVEDIPITPLESTSGCIPPEIEPSFTTTKCEERDEFKCEDPFVCQESVLNGRVVGSFCSTPVSIPFDSCDGVECDEGETCILSTIGDTMTGQCVPDTIRESLRAFRTLVFL